MKIARYFLVAIIVILIDQASKLLVYNNMYLHEEIYVLGDWFRIHYLLNPGMAFGIRGKMNSGNLP
jgi:signal peptidase II